MCGNRKADGRKMIKTKHWRFGGQFLAVYDLPKGERAETARRGYFHICDNRPTMCLEEIDICRRFELWDEGKLVRVIESRPATAADLAPELGTELAAEGGINH